MYRRFSLSLMLTHACNMRCSYCYGGEKYARAMPEEIACKAIDRALASLEPGGHLMLGFFGGEPLLRARFIGRLMADAEEQARRRPARVTYQLTTNGTLTHGSAWQVMARPDVELAVSYDGLPEVHDRHRRFGDGRPTARTVLKTMQRLTDSGKEFSVVMVVRPDDLDCMAAGVDFLREFGVGRVELSLDLWADWQPSDLEALEAAVTDAARAWRAGLPDFSVNWFDEKAAGLCGVGPDVLGRCGFGNGELAVAPSGTLYPCERLIGEDHVLNPMRLRGHVLDGADFLNVRAIETRCDGTCGACAAQSLCNTTCGCCNYVRTGDPARPDRLLCLWNQVCLRETARCLAPAAAGTITTV